MYEKLKNEIKEIVEIVKQCPDGLQEKCFELLLENFLNSTVVVTKEGRKVLPTPQNDPSATDCRTQPIEASVTTDDNTEEISMKDFHVKVRKFLENNGISMEIINELYYKENQKLMPLYDTLKTTSMSECQIRLALLTAFENSFSNDGEMTFNCEEIRVRCQAMKCYNLTNFTSYFKSSATLWENWPEKYNKTLTIVVSSEGKKRLAEILLDLAKGE